MASSMPSLRVSSSTAVLTVYCACLSGLALVIGGLGPALPGLSRQLSGASLDVKSMFFTARGCGYIVGSLLGGCMYDRLAMLAAKSGSPTISLSLHADFEEAGSATSRTRAAQLCASLSRLLRRNAPHAYLSAAMVLLAVASFATPLLRDSISAMAICSLVGFSCGNIDTGVNTLLAWHHGENERELGVAMQILHLFFAIGALISPLLASAALELSDSGDGKGSVAGAFISQGVWCMVAAATPFLIPSPMPPAARQMIVPMEDEDDEEEDAEAEAEADVTDAVHTGGSAAGGGGGENEGDDERRAAATTRADAAATKKTVAASKAETVARCSLVACVSTFLCAAVGLEVATGGLVSTFVLARFCPPPPAHALVPRAGERELLHVGCRESIAALVASSFWLGLTLGRLVAVFVARCGVGPSAMLIADVAVAVLSAVALIITSLSFESAPRPTVTFAATGDFAKLFHGSSDSAVSSVWSMEWMMVPMWCSVFFLGVAVASMFPSAVLIPQAAGYQLTGKDMGAFTAGASIGEIIVPLLVGLSISHTMPTGDGFVWAVGFAVLLTALPLIFIVLLFRKNALRDALRGRARAQAEIA